MSQQLTPEQQANLEAHFAMWRFHMWGKNLGSYIEIERKVDAGALTPFICPDKECDCHWRKELPA